MFWCAVIQWINRKIFKKQANYILCKKILRICAEPESLVDAIHSGVLIVSELTWQNPMRSVSIDRPIFHKDRMKYRGHRVISVQVAEPHQSQGENPSRGFYIFTGHIPPGVNLVQYQLEEHKAVVLPSGCCLIPFIHTHDCEEICMAVTRWPPWSWSHLLKYLNHQNK